MKLTRFNDLIEGGGGKKRVFNFGGDYSRNGGKRISVSLKTADGEPLGVELIFTKYFFGRDGQAFLSLQRSVEESRIEAGLSFKF